MSEETELTEEQKAGFEYHKKLVADLTNLMQSWQRDYTAETESHIDYVQLYRKFLIAVGEVACILAIDTSMDEASFVDLMQKMYKARLAISPRFS